MLVGVGYKSLNRGFVKYLGATASQVTIGKTLDNARKSIGEIGLSVAEAACPHGYANPSAFITTAFVRRFGYTPGVMRKRWR